MLRVKQFSFFVATVLGLFVSLPIQAQSNRGGAVADAAITSVSGGLDPVLTMWSEMRVVSQQQTSTEGRSIAAEFVSANQDPEGDMPRELTVTPDGTTAVIINRDTDTMTFFDVDSRIITHTVSVQDFPVDVAVTPDGRYALAPNVFSNSLSVVDIVTHSVVAHVPITGDQPYRVSVTSDSQFAVVGVVNDGTNSAVSVIDLDSLTEVRSFSTTSQGVFGGFFTPESGIFGNIFTQFALSSDDTTLVLPDRFNDQIAIYDITTGTQLAILAAAPLPTAIDISSDGTKAVISHEGSIRTVTVLDLIGLVVSNTVATPADLFGQVICLTPDNAFSIVAIANNVVFVNLANGNSTTLATGSVGDIEISFDGQFAFVSNLNSRVIDIASQTIVRTIPFEPCKEAVTSPTELRAITVNNRFREDVLVFNINGANGFAEGSTLTGEPEEGDATRTLVFTPDGTKVVATNNTSDNVSIFDVASRSVEAYVPTGPRPLGIAVSPDGSHAVVANSVNNTTSIIDLATQTNVANLFTGTSPAEVAVSPDGQMAYVTSVAGTDRVHFIELDGPNSNVVGSIVTGQMGSVLYTYNVLSGLTVSPDGSVLAVCISFDDELLLIDTATRTEIARVPVGDFPIRATFAPDGQRAYVTNSFSDDVYVVAIDGPSSNVEAIVPGIEFPLDVVVDESGSFAYAASFDIGAPSIKIIDANLQSVVATLSLNDRPRRLHLSDNRSTLYVMTTGGELVRISASGPTSSVIDTTQLTNGGSDLAFNEATATVAVAQPIPDGIDIVRDILIGDVNLDGVVDLLDVAPFVALLTGGSFQLEADINQDGVVDLLDVAPFVALLTG